MKINALQTSRINLHAQLTSMCSLEKQVGIRTVKGGGWGGTHMEAMDPTSSSCWTLRDDTGSLFTRQRRDKQLVLIIGLISDVRGDEEEEEAATAAVHTPHPHELPFAPPLICIPLCLVTSLQIFCLGRNQSISQSSNVSMCVIRGHARVPCM